MSSAGLWLLMLEAFAGRSAPGRLRFSDPSRACSPQGRVRLLELSPACVAAARHLYLSFASAVLVKAPWLFFHPELPPTGHGRPKHREERLVLLDDDEDECAAIPEHTDIPI